MAKLNTELGQALRERDEARRLLESLKRLETDDSVSEADRDSLRSDYEARLQHADAEVARVRGAIETQLQDVELERQKLAQEQTTLDVRHKVGELDAKQYQKAVESVRSRAAELERQKLAHEALLKAESEADVAGIAAPVVRKAVQPASKRTAAPSVAAGIRSLSGRRLLLISGGLVAIGVVAIVVLVMQAGGAALPSLPNPFGGNGSDSGGQEPSQTDGTAPLVPVQAGEDSIASAETDIDMSLQFRGGSRVGTLHAEMTWDESQLELVSVQRGSLPAEALFQYGTSAGRVAVGLVSLEGIDGDVAVATLRFRVAPDSVRAGDAFIDVENVAAYDALALAPLEVMPVSGRINMVSLAWTPATVEFY
jgi:hypothetical protein